MISTPEITVFLLEAVLRASGREAMMIEQLTGSTALYPFKLGMVNLNELGRRESLEMLRSGLDGSMVRLKG